MKKLSIPISDKEILDLQISLCVVQWIIPRGCAFPLSFPEGITTVKRVH